MFIKLFWSFIFFVLLTANAYSGEIIFRYPVEGQRINQSVTKTFVFGSISPADMPFTINGQKVDVHTNGAFIAFLSVAPENGIFAFNGQLADGTTAQLNVKMGEPYIQQQSKDAWVNITSNSSDIEIEAGDPVKITALGTSGKEAYFSIAGLVKDLPLSEYPDGSGRYSGIYWSKPADEGKKGKVTVKFKTGIFQGNISSSSKGTVRVISSPRLLETAMDNAVVRNAIDGGYMLFLDKGVKLIANGRVGSMYRVWLSPSETGWIDNSKVQPVLSNKLPIPPFAESGNIDLQSAKYGTDVSISLRDRVPYSVEETDFGMRLKLYYTNLHTNWIVYDSSDTVVKNVTFRQAEENIAEIDIFTNEPVWGYAASYTSNALMVQIRRKPVILQYWPKPLAGLNIVVDPGHSPKYTPPYDGAIGPTGLFEFQCNMAIAQKLRDRLIEYGANVIMTRLGEETVALADRPKIARDNNGDIFISVHNNALADGRNPFNPPLGYQIYYYHQHSRALGAAIHGEYKRNISIPDQGLRYGDYLVARQTWMPAVLTETAYLILPQQEEMLNNPDFQDLAAKSMADGVLKFMNVKPAPSKTIYKRKNHNKLQIEPQGNDTVSKSTTTNAHGQQPRKVRITTGLPLFRR